MSSWELAVRVCQIVPATQIGAALGMPLDLALKLCEASKSLADRSRPAAGPAEATPGRRVVEHPGGRRTVHLSGPDALDALRGYMARPV